MRLAITRSAEQLEDLRRMAAGRGVEIVPLPLTIFEDEPFDLPSDFTSTQDGWIIFTSANGVRSFLAGLDERGMEIPGSYRIAVVGKKSEAAVRERGYQVSFVPSQPYGKVLFEELIAKFGKPGSRFIYARAEQVTTDPAELFRATGVDYYPIVCYRTLQNEIGEAAIRKLSAEDAILFTAPSSVRFYSKRFGHPKARVIAIGATTAEEMEQAGWNQIVTMPEPDIERVLELV